MTLKSKISHRFPGLLEPQIEQIACFYDLLIKENEIQNLTRLTTHEDFIEGHLLDCVELLSSFETELGQTIVDVGSGCGVPGLLSAIIDRNIDRNWVLLDSERSKVDFLQRSVDFLNKSNNVLCVWGRASEYFRSENKKIDVISRAVGQISRLLPWIDECSTWNSLFLFKGPSWANEWSSTSSKIKKNLQVSKEHKYLTTQSHQRVIVHLEKVPRRT